ncbi:UV damage repair endonuclease UvsE [Salipaludibacillus keqinensis]|uniref:UV damage repair endonuclease UvsE n=1 Tax=Salipaludibacillus keqinensis TaxID=2045207 RepID=A0A323TVB3_9BACI|nr:UV DNA damage repair endonuclease UvsE [Salipaludibacillus keqinensis]PYZ93445.1 UV damage repair endonuclease UvsE [Salipaludibacillus keqinensis]
MKLGYACINTELPTRFKTCRLATYQKNGTDVIKPLTINNLQNVLFALKWNIEHDIFFFRISSDIVPLGSHEEMTWEWWKDDDVLNLTDEINQLRDSHDMRLSMHPGQYTVLSTPKEKVYERGIDDLEYHDRLLNLVGGTDIIIHGGGAYGDIEKAKQRFAENYTTLSSSIKNKLRLENDDVTYTLKDVLDIYDLCAIPICFDIHHHRCNHDDTPLEPMLDRVFRSWPKGWIPKVHISSGNEHKTDRRHHDVVFKDDFQNLLNVLNGQDADIMLEAKKKEQAVLKIQQEVFNQGDGSCC